MNKTSALLETKLVRGEVSRRILIPDPLFPNFDHVLVPLFSPPQFDNSILSYFTAVVKDFYPSWDVFISGPSRSLPSDIRENGFSHGSGQDNLNHAGRSTPQEMASRMSRGDKGGSQLTG